LRAALEARPLRLNPGVPATEVACRAGYAAAVLLKIHAHRVDHQGDAANRRITDALVGQQPFGS
jgi:protein-L-isoaspartate O-methyltransferase